MPQESVECWRSWCRLYTLHRSIPIVLRTALGRRGLNIRRSGVRVNRAKRLLCISSGRVSVNFGMSWASHRTTRATRMDPVRKGNLLIALIPLRRDAWERCLSGGRIILISEAGVRSDVPLVRYTTSPLPDPKPSTPIWILLIFFP